LGRGRRKVESLMVERRRRSGDQSWEITLPVLERRRPLDRVSPYRAPV
jgi:hypothetical protein